MLNGIDVSHWNDENVVRDFIREHKTDFIIAKATEGKTFKDVKFAKFMELADDYDIRLKGAYHFYKCTASPGQNAKNFLNVVSKYINGRFMLVIDIEGGQCESRKTWEDVLECCLIIYKATGIIPVVYTNAYNVKYMTELKKNDIGLWVANYGVDKPKTGQYKNGWALWQYTNRPLDRNYFNGSYNQFVKYCMPV